MYSIRRTTTGKKKQNRKTETSGQCGRIVLKTLTNLSKASCDRFRLIPGTAAAAAADELIGILPELD